MSQAPQQSLAIDEFALIEAGRMRIAASEAWQCGFLALADWLSKNADAAMNWAARKGTK